MADDPWAAFPAVQSQPPAQAQGNDPWAAFPTVQEAPPVTFNAPDAPKPLTIKAGPPDPADGGDAGAAVGGGLISGAPIVGPAAQWLVERGVVAPLRMLSHGESWDDAVKAAQTFDQATEKNHPVATAVGQAGGAALAMAPVVAAAPALFGAGQAGSFLGRTAIGAASGGVLGGADSAVRSGGDLGSTAIGTVAGLAGGGAAPAIGRIIGAGADALAQNAALRGIGLDRGDANLLMRTMANDGSFNGQGLANIQAAGPDAMLVDAGPNARQVLDTALQRGGGAAQEARQAIEDRAVRAGQNLDTNLNRALGTPAGTTAIATDLRTGSAPARQAAYDAAYGTPIDYSAPEGQAVEALFDRIPGSALTRANSLMAIEGNQSQQMMLRQMPDGSYQLSHYPDTRQLDYVTRALNDVAQRGDGQGALGGNTAEGRAYGGLSRDIRQALRRANPAYGTALDTASEPIRAINAMQTGNDLLKPSTLRDVAAEQIGGLQSADEMAHARLGARAYIDDKAANVTRTATDPNVDARQSLQTLKDLSSPAAQQKLGLLVQDPGDAAALQRAMERAAIAQELRASVTRNSATYARQATDQAVKEASAPGVIGRLARGEPLEAGKRFTQFLTQTRPEDQLANQDATYDRLVRALVTQRGNQAAQFLQSLQDAHGQISRTTGLLATPTARRALATALLSSVPTGARALAPSGAR
jgi:hypothetical protein